MIKISFGGDDCKSSEHLEKTIRGIKMDTAKLFRTGNSQAVRLPKEFRLPGDMVKIFRQGNKIILEPMEPTWETLFESLDEFPEDFFKDGRQQPLAQTREPF